MAELLRKIKKNNKSVDINKKVLYYIKRARENCSCEQRMHEWLSGGVSPCQGEGRGFESRLVLFYLQGVYMKDACCRLCNTHLSYKVELLFKIEYTIQSKTNKSTVICKERSYKW